MHEAAGFPDIVLDIDEVILDWRTAFVAWMVANGHELRRAIAGHTAWDLAPMFGITDTCAWNTAIDGFCASDSYRALPFLDGARDGLAALAQMVIGRARLVALTATGNGDAAFAARHSLLSALPFDEAIVIRHGESKVPHLQRLAPLVFIDDAPGNVAEAIAAGIRAQVFDRPFNRGGYLPRVAGWPALLEMVDEVLDEHDQICRTRMVRREGSEAHEKCVATLTDTQCSPKAPISTSKDRSLEETPCIGIWWFCRSSILKFAQPLHEVESINGWQDSPASHFELWPRLQAEQADLRSDEYTDHQRGRVLFRQEDESFVVYGSKSLIWDKHFQRQIVGEFHLPVGKTIFVADAHYEPTVPLLENIDDECRDRWKGGHRMGTPHVVRKVSIFGSAMKSRRP